MRSAKRALCALAIGRRADRSEAPARLDEKGPAIRPADPLRQRFRKIPRDNVDENAEDHGSSWQRPRRPPDPTTPDQIANDQIANDRRLLEV